MGFTSNIFPTFSIVYFPPENVAFLPNFPPEVVAFLISMSQSYGFYFPPENVEPLLNTAWLFEKYLLAKVQSVTPFELALVPLLQNKKGSKGL